MSPAHRVERVTILGSRDATTVVIPWDSRKALLDRLDAAGGAEDVIAAIRAVDTSRPIALTNARKRRLFEVVEGWLWEVSTTGLPDGIFELRNALIDERDSGDLDDDA
jgi:hypothetical protein